MKFEPILKKEVDKSPSLVFMYKNTNKRNGDIHDITKKLYLLNQPWHVKICAYFH